ncbi:enhanced serine sensitivity protein SseB C-terminal domain-containing protein, partial [Streptomyces sp. 8P21H-1]
VERLQETIAAIPGFEARYVGIPCRAFWETTRGATLVLNPHSAHGKEFLPGEVAHLLDGAASVTSRVVERGTEVMVGRPAHVPPGMEDALSALFARHDAVDEAVLGWKVTPSANDQSYLLVVIGAGDVRERVGDDLARSLVMFSQAHPVDVMYTT